MMLWAQEVQMVRIVTDRMKYGFLHWHQEQVIIQFRLLLCCSLLSLLLPLYCVLFLLAFLTSAPLTLLFSSFSFRLSFRSFPPFHLNNLLFSYVVIKTLFFRSLLFPAIPSQFSLLFSCFVIFAVVVDVVVAAAVAAATASVFFPLFFSFYAGFPPPPFFYQLQDKERSNTLIIYYLFRLPH